MDYIYNSTLNMSIPVSQYIKSIEKAKIEYDITLEQYAELLQDIACGKIILSRREHDGLKNMIDRLTKHWKRFENEWLIATTCMSLN